MGSAEAHFDNGPGIAATVPGRNDPAAINTKGSGPKLSAMIAAQPSQLVADFRRKRRSRGCKSFLINKTFPHVRVVQTYTLFRPMSFLACCSGACFCAATNE